MKTDNYTHTNKKSKLPDTREYTLEDLTAQTCESYLMPTFLYDEVYDKHIDNDTRITYMHLHDKHIQSLVITHHEIVKLEMNN